MNSSRTQRLLHRRQFLNNAARATLLTTFSLTSLAQQPPKSSMRAAVIGHTGRGDYGHGMEQAFLNREGITVVAVADPDEAARTTIAAQIKAQKTYADYREMLDRERPQLVSIGMRQADQHRDVLMACLRANAHAYCEKPFVTAPFEADEVLAEATRRGLRIAVAHTMHMIPTIVALKHAIAEDYLGALTEMRAYGKQDSRAGGEDMIVLGSHLFDLMRMYAGDPMWCTARVLWKGRDITVNDARLVKDNDGPVAADEVFAQFAFPGGINGTFTSSAKLVGTIGNWGIELYGSKRAVRINCDVRPNVFVRDNTEWKADGKADRWTPFDPAVVRGPIPKNLGPVGDWLDAIATHREPECSGRNGAWVVEMTMGVYHAALKGQRVAFPLSDRRHPLEIPK